MNDWNLAEITIQNYGPRYVIETHNGFEAVNKVQFNDFTLGLDGRAEVEYRELNIEDDTAKFYD